MKDKYIIDSAEESARLYFAKHPQENLNDEALLARALQEREAFLEQAKKTEKRRPTLSQRILYTETWQETYLDIKSVQNIANLISE